jgi:hypothetical protein
VSEQQITLLSFVTGIHKLLILNLLKLLNFGFDEGVRSEGIYRLGLTRFYAHLALIFGFKL